MPDRLKVVLCWHMHQPEYQVMPEGEYQLPWTYLHAMKDYTDMASHLERHPDARAVVNFAPTLLDQISDYAFQVEEYLGSGRNIHDPLLAALANPVLPTDPLERLLLVKHCLRANETRMIQRYEAYHRLAHVAQGFIEHPDTALYLSDQFLADILVWYHLAWMGEHVHRSNDVIKQLVRKACGFSLHERQSLLLVIGELLGGIIDRYRKLAEQGRVELAVSPYAHPIVPLLLDLDSAKEAMPEIAMPILHRYPGGDERVRWHLEKGKESFERYFGFLPQGCWPSEGSVSTESIEYFQEAGFRWVASGQNVLSNSLHETNDKTEIHEHLWLYQAYQVNNIDLSCFFRDDGLSDLIGFTYSDWHADDAVANLLGHLENIAEACKEIPGSVVSIILDGENAWEHYPENGHYFLDALYQGLIEHPDLELTTFSGCLDNNVAQVEIPGLVAGSWVYGTFSTWIGDIDKNRAWDMLGDAKLSFDRIMAAGHLSAERVEMAERQMAICEGSDWFWWFGDYNPEDTVSDFEHLYRQQLTALYQILGVEPPEYLSHVFAKGGGTPFHGGAMRRGREQG